MADTSIATVPFGLLWASFPRDGRAALATALGGSVAAALSDPSQVSSVDDSLVRLSAALRGCGHPVPATSIYSGSSGALTDAAGFAYLRDSGQAETLLEHKLGKPRRCHSEADAAGRAGVLVFRGVKRGAHAEPVSHFDLWDGTTTADPASSYWKEASGVALYEIKA